MLSPTPRRPVLAALRVSLGTAAALLGLAAGLNIRQAFSQPLLLQVTGAACGLAALLATSRFVRRDWTKCFLSLGLIANVGAVLALMDEHVVIEVIYMLGFREGVWHAIAILLCAVCISLNFLGLALLPGHVCPGRAFDLGAAAWIDLEARAPVPVCCLALSIRRSLRLTLLTAMGSSLIAGCYTVLHPKASELLPSPVALLLALLPPLITATGTGLSWAWPELMNLSQRTFLARRTFCLALFGAAALLSAWFARLFELQANWTSCENLLAECSALAGRGDCDAASEYFDYMMAHCRKACRACAVSHWGLGGDLLLVLHTALVVQTLRFAYLFHQSTMQLVIADSHLTEPETPFQALEEASAKSSALRLRSETQMAEAPSRGSASQEEVREANDAARSLLAEHLAEHPIPEPETSPKDNKSDDDASFYECESLAGD